MPLISLSFSNHINVLAYSNSVSFKKEITAALTQSKTRPEVAEQGGSTGERHHPVSAQEGQRQALEFLCHSLPSSGCGLFLVSGFSSFWFQGNNSFLGVNSTGGEGGRGKGG